MKAHKLLQINYLIQIKMNKKCVNLEEILGFLGNKVQGVYGPVTNVVIDNIPDADHVTESSLDWVNPSKDNKQDIVKKSKAKVLLVDDSVNYNKDLSETGKTIIIVEQPRNVIGEIASHFFLRKYEAGIHPSAVVDKAAVIAPSAHVGAGCVIGKAQIGANSVLMPNVVIYDDVIIGDNCIIQAGAIIGTDGLGCVRDKNGKLTKFPHLGGVVIGDDVEIGANCQIAKGAFSDTIIENGCKINGLCFVAHNNHLEENVWITGDTMLCGSVHVKRNATIFSNVIIREQRVLGEKVVVGMGAVVTKNIPDGETWIGAPAHKMDKSNG